MLGIRLGPEIDRVDILMALPSDHDVPECRHVDARVHAKPVHLFTTSESV